MKSYLITYDLIKEGQNYESVIESIKSISPDNWWHCLLSTWIVKSDLTAGDILSIIRPNMDDNDKIFIVLLERESAWYLEDECSDWLKENL
jgi:hypothetical protein